jgi:hypothetical protein
MLLPYFVGICVGICIEKANNSHYYNREKIINLENKLKEYERFFGKIN